MFEKKRSSFGFVLKAKRTRTDDTLTTIPASTSAQNNHSGHYGWDSLCFSLYIFFGPVDFGVGPVKQWKIGELLARQGLVGPVAEMS